MVENTLRDYPYEVFPNCPTKHYSRKKRGSGWRSNLWEKSAHSKRSCEFTHICMLTFLRSPTSISEQIINQFKEDFSKLLKRQNPLPFFKAAT